ncbi:unnamed protein product [Parascedosporium putredinis]|uniref:DUF4604 domain-containing protein n=1 Tax=Parascedosporium putredinis TaxID=1442378 RepID=A0A9P1H8V3_9PEZI|nr:unnamed protein product [Parascedosporium putredinis]CAI8002844.1 unnamed protein product [Parascedosporium putredinis]
MSQKFNAKNLSYNSSVPPFLAALKAQASGSSSSPNPLLAGQRRHGVKRSASADAEDAPSSKSPPEEDGTGPGAETGEDGAKAGAGGLSAIGRKRKTAKVIGGGANDEEANAASSKGANAKRESGEKADEKKPAKPKKKAKKIKLSFDEDAG